MQYTYSMASRSVRSLLSAALKKWPHGQVEDALFLLYHKEGIESNTIASYLLAHHPNWERDEIVVACELCVDETTRKLDGAHFTPATIAHHLAVLSVPPNPGAIIDPTCGCGALLLAAAERAAVLWKVDIKEVVDQYIYGMDINAKSIQRCHRLLHAFTGGTARLAVADALACHPKNIWPHLNGVKGWISNPPYVRFQNLPTHQREALAQWPTVSGGNPNLYYAFFAMARKWLDSDGKWAMIIPNAWLSTASAHGVRAWLCTHPIINTITDFTHYKVFSAGAYTCIVSGDTNFHSELAYRHAVPGKLKHLEAPHMTSYATLTADAWRLVSKTQRSWISQGKKGSYRLGDLVLMRGGIATLADQAFLITDPTEKVEKNLSMPIVKTAQHGDQASLAANQLRIIYPYRGSPPVLLRQEEFAAFPLAYALLQKSQQLLQARDRGACDYPWHAYGRTQGLVALPECILIPQYTKKAIALHSPGGHLLLGGIALVGKEGTNMKQLAELLHDNLRLHQWMTAQSNAISGGYVQYSSKVLREFYLDIIS